MTDPLDQPEEATYALVMPFVVCASNGGPYEDTAFVAGFQAGRLDRALAVAAVNDTHAVRATVSAALVPQLELLGMSYGYPAVEVEPCAEVPEWVDVSFARGTDG